MKYWPGGTYLVIQITPIFTGYITLMSIGYKKEPWRFLEFISDEGVVSTDLGITYLSISPDTYYNVFVKSLSPPLYTCKIFQCFQ